MRESKLTDTAELIQHSFFGQYEVRITRNMGGTNDFSYVIGPFLTRWGAKRAARKALRGYIQRHKVKWVK